MPWQTPRLTLAPADERCAAALAALLSDPAVRGGLYPGRVGRDEPGLELIDPARFAAFDNADGQLVGTFRIGKRELSYAVAPPLWGRGLGSEIVKAVCEQVAPELGWRLLEARVQRDNVRSRRLLESCGFVYRGAWAQNEWHGLSVLSYRRRIATPARHA